jgi:phenylalanyl-tRNA synthetase beta chain
LGCKILKSFNSINLQKMTISYNWLQQYLPVQVEVNMLSKILTSIGLEVESVEKFESIKGSLEGLVIGEVIDCQKHPNADKLSITQVNIGTTQQLQIVCGAANVAKGQKIVVATVGSTIYPATGEPLTMKAMKIRQVESNGMICAEDEIGLGNSHEGILVLPNDVEVGSTAASYFKPTNDFIFEIGLTPNRMDAMSHLGVAKDVCAYLTHHNNIIAKPKLPFNNSFKIDNEEANIEVEIINKTDCLRYSGVSINNITVAASPKWLQDSLHAIGLKSINNIVDITNFILHETGQPLHAFDASAIANNKIIVTCLPNGTSFTTLDDKQRTLFENNLVICDGNQNPMCIAGVFGGSFSGINETTTNIFLESACFLNTSIRKTSLQHGLRTDAATRFEKGVDISNTVNVLKRAALLIKEIAGGNISSHIVDEYPNKKEKVEVSLKYHYLKKITGKNYHSDAIKKIVEALGFEIMKDGIDELRLAVPFSKPDITLPADIVEEILRIDGIDNIEIPTSITLTPAIETNNLQEALQDKIANYLVGQGYYEILTNSITNSNYYSKNELENAVIMLNSLTTELDVLRPSMLQTGLETIAYNINRKNTQLNLFEIGKTYHKKEVGKYIEQEHVSIYITGKTNDDVWQQKAKPKDIYIAKGWANAIANVCGIGSINFVANETADNLVLDMNIGNKNIGKIEEVAKSILVNFDIKQPVYFIDFNFDALLKIVAKQKIVYKEVTKFPSIQRDLAIIVDKNITYNQLEAIIEKQKLNNLKQTRLFDIFEGEKLGANKKSFAINFTFLDSEKTLTDKEIETMMNKLMGSFEKELSAEIKR